MNKISAALRAGKDMKPDHMPRKSAKNHERKADDHPASPIFLSPDSDFSDAGDRRPALIPAP
jgi:hypothetical protein